MRTNSRQATHPHRRFATAPAIVAGFLASALLALLTHSAAADDGPWFSLATGSCDAPSFTSEVEAGQTVLLLSGGLMANAPLDYSVSPYSEGSRPAWWSLAQTVHTDSSGSVCVEAFGTAAEDYGIFLVTVNGLDANQRQFNPPSQGVTVTPAVQPIETPTPEPTEPPTPEPTETPTPEPSGTPEPTGTPTPEPTEPPTPEPTEPPTPEPTEPPIPAPTDGPSLQPIESSPPATVEEPPQGPLPEPAPAPVAVAEAGQTQTSRPARAAMAGHKSVQTKLLVKMRAGLEKLFKANWLESSRPSGRSGAPSVASQAFRGAASISRVFLPAGFRHPLLPASPWPLSPKR